ncbi:Protein CBG17913 [Caenorhabditis briggsae]|uniref:Protein CBG17913 n=1 Tax=Caenorhabditis briggsae TaxID=6238 RepID=A8XS34_CAEBR|nr:Protein CBG17913 [Caenorhabditis briggsae]CAP35453.1 Protein CBG17913 [Caenorhabditis briggsae]
MKPTWQRIPIEVKEEIIQFLDFKSSLSEELLADLVKTKNWKNADQIFFYGRQEIPMDSVLHLDKIRFYTTDFTTIDAWNLIDSFITRQNLKPGFGFRVNFGTALSEDDVLEGFKNGTKYSNSSKIVILPTKSADLIFVVKMRRSIFGYQDLEGYVCNKDFKQDEFKKYSSWVPENHLQMTRRLQSQILPIPPWFLFVRSVVQASEQL